MNSSNNNNNTTNDGSTIVNNSTMTVNDYLSGFMTKLSENPVDALVKFPVITAVLIFLPILVFYHSSSIDGKSSSRKKKSSGNGYDFEKEELEAAKDFAKKLEAFPSIWQIGVSSRGVSVSSEGALRYFLHTEDSVPTAEDIVQCLFFAIQKPIVDIIDQTAELSKPKWIVFNEFSIANAAVANVVKERVSDFGMVLKKLDEISSTDIAEITKAKIAQAKNSKVEDKPDFNPPPPRMCYVCREKITDKKPSQCSACKAIIYCSAACAKKDWPQHKELCPILKSAMQSIQTKKLHDFPFTFYTQSSPLQIYNAVIFLVREGLHNGGLYRRICHCFDQVPYGQLASETRKTIENLPEGDDKAKYDALCLPDAMYPLNKPIPAITKNKIDSWESLYDALNVDKSSPVALILEYPMTVYYILTQYLFPKGVPKDRPVELHLLGVEKELDLIPSFEILVALLPGVKLILRMVGPGIASDLPPEHMKYEYENKELSSNLKIELTRSIYNESHYTGEAFQKKKKEDKSSPIPDGVLLLNPALLAYETWVPTVNYLINQEAKLIFTEMMEPNIEMMGRNLMMIGSKYSKGHVVNPFRQPVHRWSPDCNFPGFSNGFICFVNV